MTMASPAIEAQDCDQVAVLVIRWYGGIQLGTGGLARAYGGGANKCLQAAPKVELISRVAVSCACAFGELTLVKLRVAEMGGLVVEETFTANGVELRLAVGESQIDTLQAQLADLSRGRILLQR
jgi:putative IMPACT (imprinted ancient) family translation regulator